MSAAAWSAVRALAVHISLRLWGTWHAMQSRSACSSLQLRLATFIFPPMPQARRGQQADEGVSGEVVLHCGGRGAMPSRLLCTTFCCDLFDPLVSAGGSD